MVHVRGGVKLDIRARRVCVQVAKDVGQLNGGPYDFVSQDFRCLLAFSPVCALFPMAYRLGTLHGSRGGERL